MSLAAALRAKELGEDYKSRLNVGAPSVGGKAPAAKPAKGAPAAAEAKTAVWNEFVKDPDELLPCVAPTDPLVIGAFSVLQRVGTVLPGETSFFDIKFDPSGCASAHERLAIFITGVDHGDESAHFLKNFDVTGDSCIPAIADGDMSGIFEEQEIVSSLSEASTGRNYESHL